jgi:enamine deaminase RidA (YjgF/YER057c/UK114 family)
MHVQSVSTWAPPNIGPYSQMNIVDDTIFLAGCIGLFPPALALISQTDISLQYKQIKWSLTKVLREGLKDIPDISWQSKMTKSAIIFVAKDSDLEGLLPTLQKDFEFIKESTVIIRVEKLPMMCLIEIELIMSKKADAKCQQVFDSVSETNSYGEVYAVNPSSLNLKSKASLIPVNEIIKLDGQKVDVVERFY